MDLTPDPGAFAARPRGTSDSRATSEWRRFRDRVEGGGRAVSGRETERGGVAVDLFGVLVWLQLLLLGVWDMRKGWRV